VDLTQFDEVVKKEIEEDIEKDFHQGYIGIKKLPKSARFGVYIAYVYYYQLFQKIKDTNSKIILQERIRISNQKKYSLLLSSYVKHSFNLI
jgi:phytoene/squalene synthetase